MVEVDVEADVEAKVDVVEEGILVALSACNQTRTGRLD